MKMQYKQSFLVLSTFLLLLVVRESYSELMCYVCDHCSSITPRTPSMACNADYFSSVGAELPSTMTTTNSPSETMRPADTTSTGAITTTEETAASKDNSTMTSTSTMTTTPTTSIVPSTLMATSTEFEIKSTTDREVSSSTMPSTRPKEEVGSEGVYSESTGMPIVPFLDSIKPIMDSVFTYNTTIMGDQPPVVDEDMMNMTTTTSRSYMNSSTFRVRQARHVMPADSDSDSDSNAMTYHCYTVQVVSNNTLDTRRGCARVSAVETVCGQLKKASSGETPVNKCNQCSTDLCNGSSALGVSMATLLLGLVAVMLKQR